ncbi:aminotransferase class IV [Croceivirga thetidis]|uniref:Aminotransferase class IV n=1 Tax=Croceivirga thetidis TaxID=2721623 RepID=A0ABX1GT28_9FLAO|nr:aminotransferase class IV [Croceivirga thetidis]NKI32055.1 aminotransferase class IV [Croceivirga thetidis]
MVNFDGRLIQGSSDFLNHQNRAFKFGDAIFERLRLISGKLVFWEDHYFRLISSMRILRMKIPMEFTMEFFEQEISRLTTENSAEANFEVHLFIFRKNSEGLSQGQNLVSYLIELKPLAETFYQIKSKPFELELFKDYYIAPGLLSSLSSSNNLVLTVAEIFSKENDYDACFLLNSNKSVIGTTKGNIFLVKENLVKTPQVSEGVKNTVIRKNVAGIFEKWDDYEFQQEPVSPFELQKADELFVVDDILGIIPVSKYRKKEYSNEVAKKLVGRLNTLARLS